MKTLFDDRHQEINGDSDPDLRANGVFGDAVKGFDAQVLLDPFEEQFHLPSAAVELRDGQGRLAEIVGEKDQSASAERVAIANSSQGLWIFFEGIKLNQDDGLIEEQARAFVHRLGIAAAAPETLARSGDKESATAMHAVKTVEIRIGFVHDVKTSRLEGNLVQEVDVVRPRGREEDHGGEGSAQAQQGVEFDAGLALAKARPREKRQTQIDRGGVQRIGLPLQFQSEGFSSVKRTGLLNQNLAEIGKDAPVAPFVGVGQSAARDRVPNAAVIKFRPQGAQARFDIAQTFPPSQLRESHNQELLVSGEGTRAKIAAVALHTFVELVFGKKIHQLGENRATFVHRGLPSLYARPRREKRETTK